MQVINKQEVKSHEDRIAAIKEQFDAHVEALGRDKPQPITLKKVKEKPKDLGNGVVAMPGDYYSESADGSVLVISADDIGENGAWQQV